MIENGKVRPCLDCPNTNTIDGHPDDLRRARFRFIVDQCGPQLEVLELVGVFCAARDEPWPHDEEPNIGTNSLIVSSSSRTADRVRATIGELPANGRQVTIKAESSPIAARMGQAMCEGVALCSGPIDGRCPPFSKVTLLNHLAQPYNQP
jgi:hypothetical protein